ncbi:MAG: DNA-binding response regulator, partial [Mesorhizobium sp.]
MSTVVVADPRGVYLAGLEWVLRKAGHDVVAECHRVVDVLPHVERQRPDIAIIGLDLADPQTAGLS